MADQAVVTFAFIFELVGALFLLCFIFVMMFRRYLERRRNATLFLSLAIFVIGISILISSIGRLVALLEGIDPLVYHGFQYTPFVWIALALALNVVGDIFFLLFANQLFYNGSKKITIFVVIMGAIVTGVVLILVPTPSMVGDEPTVAYQELFQLIWLIQALFTFATGGLITYRTFKDARTDRPLVEKRGLLLIGALGISLALTNIMFIIDEQLTPYFGGDFSAFYYIGWIIAHIGIVLAYLGFILPNWLRKRWE